VAITAGNVSDVVVQVLGCSVAIAVLVLVLVLAAAGVVDGAGILNLRVRIISRILGSPFHCCHVMSHGVRCCLVANIPMRIIPPSTVLYRVG
jgi:hypothetical protein